MRGGMPAADGNRALAQKNPWESVSLADYEAHMALSQVGQLQALAELTKRQLEAHPVQTVCILGVAGGNGLAHIGPGIRRVYGVDVCQAYLDQCAARYAALGERLVLQRADLTDPRVFLPDAELFIANLLVEYIGIPTFAGHIARRRPRYLSCVIQQNADETFVSASPYAEAFAGISTIHADIDARALTAALAEAGMECTKRERYSLPNGKRLVMLDYAGK